MSPRRPIATRSPGGKIAPVGDAAMIIKRVLTLIALCAASWIVCAAPGLAASDQSENRELSAQRGARITIFPGHRPLGPNAKRECHAWLEKEYRVSGPVIVPRQRCWWQ